MTTTSIQWTDRVWNPVTGCDKVSPGCAHCYAETVADRFWATQYDHDVPCASDDPRASCSALQGGSVRQHYRPRIFTDVQSHEDRLDAPLRWRKPCRVFVNSMSDLFHEDVPDVFIDRVFAVMALAPQHTFQILTKRPERMRDYMTALDLAIRLPTTTFPRWRADAEIILGDRRDTTTIVTSAWPLPNVCLGVSVENQHFADERIPILLQTPAAGRFISAEPLLGPITLHALPGGPGRWQAKPGDVRCLDWVIVGGESGPKARPCDVAWIRSIVRQCREADVPAFVKQLGAKPLVPACRQTHWDYRFIDRAEHQRFKPFDSSHWLMNLRDRKGGDPSEWPVDLRVRAWPEARG